MSDDDEPKDSFLADFLASGSPPDPNGQSYEAWRPDGTAEQPQAPAKTPDNLHILRPGAKAPVADTSAPPGDNIREQLLQLLNDSDLEFNQIRAFNDGEYRSELAKAFVAHYLYEGQADAPQVEEFMNTASCFTGWQPQRAFVAESAENMAKFCESVVLLSIEWGKVPAGPHAPQPKPKV